MPITSRAIKPRSPLAGPGSAVRVALLASALVSTTAGAIGDVEIRGTEIHWQGDAWYQVQDAESYRTVPGCEGRINRCDVGVAGTYNIVSLHARREGIVVDPSPPISAGSAPGLAVSHARHACELTPRGSIERQLLGPNDRCSVECPLDTTAIGGGCEATPPISLPPPPGADLTRPSSGRLDRRGYTCIASEGDRVTASVACLSVATTASNDTLPAAVPGVPELHYRETSSPTGEVLYVGRLRWQSAHGATAYDVLLDGAWIATSHGTGDHAGLAIAWSTHGTGNAVVTTRVQVIARSGAGSAAPSADARLVYAPRDPSLD